MVALTALPLWCAETITPNGESIRVSADRLIAHGQQEYAEFTGNVRAISADFDITADNLKIFYEPSSADATGNTDETVSTKTVSRIIATGDVVILSAGKIAKTEKAEYNKGKQTIILTGKGSQVNGEDGYITGETIVMHTGSNSVTVESGQGQRVQAVINTGPEALKQEQDNIRP
jgi:lipopolysaccharide transport protein LptA